jgi:transposase
MLTRMARTLAAHRSGLMASYDAMITSGPMEGTTNEVETRKRQGYGFRDWEYFKSKILGDPREQARISLTRQPLWFVARPASAR